MIAGVLMTLHDITIASIIEKIRESVEFICSSNGVHKSMESKSDISYLRNNKGKPKALKDSNVRKNEKKQFIIDVSKLDKIRTDAELIQEKLVIENDVAIREEEINDIHELKMLQETIQSSYLQSNEENEWQELFGELSSYELQTLLIILDQINANPKLEELSKKSGILMEVMIEGINEKALEIIGDNLIESSEEVPIIYEDYISYIRKFLQEEK